ncbi:MAG TPA: RbsD/FucU domain-containing protein [Allosphingosinicella sp.]|jgi:L-fucose mutarotase
MLKGIDPILGPELLAALRAMGHGDDIAIVDANFPAAANARRLMRVDGVDAVRVTAAVAALMPLDDFVPAAAWRMAVVDAPDEVPPVTALFEEALRANGYSGPIEAVERHAFYERARGAFAVVATGEARLYGNLLLRKGVIRPGE